MWHSAVKCIVWIQVNLNDLFLPPTQTRTWAVHLCVFLERKHVCVRSRVRARQQSQTRVGFRRLSLPSGVSFLNCMQGPVQVPASSIELLMQSVTQPSTAQSGPRSNHHSHLVTNRGPWLCDVTECSELRVPWEHGGGKRRGKCNESSWSSLWGHWAAGPGNGRSGQRSVIVNRDEGVRR